MFVGFAVGELTDLFCGYIDGEDVQTLIVVEAGHAFAGVGLVEIPGDDPGIPSGFGGFFAGNGGDESKLFAVGGPGELFARARERTVGAIGGCEKSDVRAVGSSDE